MLYAVVKLDNDAMADQFDPAVFTSGTLVGLFKGPTTFCDPSDGHRGKKTEAGWTRGKKYGWWVCAKCKKPSTQWAASLNAVLGAARNLIGGNDATS